MAESKKSPKRGLERRGEEGLKIFSREGQGSPVSQGILLFKDLLEHGLGPFLDPAVPVLFQPSGRVGWFHGGLTVIREYIW